MSRPGQGVMVPGSGLGFPPQNVARVVVWEWLNEHSRWRPYTATVCHHIENVLKEDARGSVVLGQVDTQLVPYIIDLQSMHQFRQDTGESAWLAQRALWGESGATSGARGSISEGLCGSSMPVAESVSYKLQKLGTQSMLGSGPLPIPMRAEGDFCPQSWQRWVYF